MSYKTGWKLNSNSKVIENNFISENIELEEFTAIDDTSEISGETFEDTSKDSASEFASYFHSLLNWKWPQKLPEALASPDSKKSPDLPESSKASNYRPATNFESTLSLRATNLRNKIDHHVARTTNSFINQVDLMLNIMPIWANFMSDRQVYGHYTFVNRHNSDLAVFLTLDAPGPELSAAACGQESRNDSVRSSGPELVSSGPRPEIRSPPEDMNKTITDLFYPYGCRVLNCHLNYLDANTRLESYHQNYLKRPINNQRYQLFLLALENYTNWCHYQARVEGWEIDQLLNRYLRSNLLMMLNSLPRRKPKLVQLEPWIYIIEPFAHLNFSLTEIHEKAINSLQLKESRMKAVKYLINLAYGVYDIDDPDGDMEPAVSGIWPKVFMQY